MVRLRLFRKEEDMNWKIGFNPTMVRLRPSSTAVTVTALPRFNPTMVRLRRLARPPGRHQLSRFNPTMVRLRRPSSTSSSGRQSKFQSHYGAIATRLTRFAPALYPRFNPTMVRLRLARAVNRSRRQIMVSIPLWCDCDLGSGPCRG